MLKLRNISLSIFLLTASLCAHADKVSYDNLVAAWDSGKYECTSSKQVKMVVSEDQATGVVPPVCLYNVACKPNKGTAAPSLNPFLVQCKTDGESCKDLSACVEELRLTTADGTIFWNKGEEDRKAVDPDVKDRFGHDCKYSWGSPFVIFRQYPGKRMWDTVCASPIEGCKLPETVKGSFLATCKAGKQLKPGILECPAPQACLEKAIPVKPTPTKSEAAALAASGNRTQTDRTATPVTFVGASAGGSIPAHRK